MPLMNGTVYLLNGQTIEFSRVPSEDLDNLNLMMKNNIGTERDAIVELNSWKGGMVSTTTLRVSTVAAFNEELEELHSLP